MADLFRLQLVRGHRPTYKEQFARCFSLQLFWNRLNDHLFRLFNMSFPDVVVISSIFFTSIDYEKLIIDWYSRVEQRNSKSERNISTVVTVCWFQQYIIKRHIRSVYLVIHFSFPRYCHWANNMICRYTNAIEARAERNVKTAWSFRQLTTTITVQVWNDSSWVWRHPTIRTLVSERTCRADRKTRIAFTTVTVVRASPVPSSALTRCEYYEQADEQD